MTRTSMRFEEIEGSGIEERAESRWIYRLWICVWFMETGGDEACDMIYDWTFSVLILFPALERREKKTRGKKRGTNPRPWPCRRPSWLPNRRTQRLEYGMVDNRNFQRRFRKKAVSVGEDGSDEV